MFSVYYCNIYINMEVNTSPQLTKQKQQAILISSYKQAVALLQGTHTREQGKQALLSILQNPDTHENALRQLRLSTLLSLAQLSKVEGQNMNALYYWHQATKIQPAFNTWIKMAQVLESLRTWFLSATNQQKESLNVGLAQIQDQIQYVYKNAIKESPKLWKDQLLQKLQETYINHGKMLQAEDLSQTIKYINCNESTNTKESKQNHDDPKKKEPNVHGVKQKNQSLPQIEISMSRVQRCSEVTPWDFLLSFCLFLMNTPSSLKRTSKKHEEVLSRLSKFNEHRTTISLKNHNQRQEKQKRLQSSNEDKKEKEDNRMQQQENSNEQDEKLTLLMIDYFKQMNREKQNNGAKMKKPQNVPLSYSNKSTFDSFQDYMKEVSVSKSINFTLLHSFKYIDPAYNPRIQLLSNRTDSLFDAIFSPILQEPKPNDKECQNQNQEQACNVIRERRSISQGTPQPATPMKRQSSEQLKVQQQKQLKLKIEISKFIVSIKQAKFNNVLHLSQTLVLNMLMAYKKCGLGDEFFLQGSQQQRKSTSKLISHLLIKILEVSESSILDNPTINRMGFILLIRTMEDQLNNSNSVGKFASLQSLLLNKLTTSIDSLIYAQSQSHRSNQYKSYSLEDLQYLLEQIYLSILLCTMPSLPANEPKAKKLSSYYNKLHSLYITQINSSDQLFLQSRIIPEPSKMEEIVENRMRRLKIKEFGQQEGQQPTLIANIDKLLKHDLKTSEIIDSVKTIVTMGTGSLLLYLKSFAKVVDILFTNLENNGGFNIRFVQNSLKAMQIPMLISALHSKLTQGKKLQKDPKQSQDQMAQQQTNTKPIIDINTIDLQRSDYNIKIQTIFNLIKIYLLNQMDQVHSSLCLRIVFYLLEETFKTMVLFQNVGTQGLDLHYQYSDQLCLIIIFLDSLVKMKESGDLRKKFYHRVLIKNIRYIYDLYNHAASGHNEIRVQVYKIYNQTFHHKSFKPKKMEDCLGYFLMISRQFSSEFDKQEVQFQQKMRRVFNECYLIFKQQYHKTFEQCQRFTRAMQFFVYVMRKKRKQCQQFINFFTGKTQICECCQGPYLTGNISKQPFAKQVFFVVAKFLQNKRNAQKISAVSKETSNDQEVSTANKETKKPLNLIQLDDQVQKSYLRYFLVAVNTGKAWYQMLRFQISKVYQSFDALIGPQIENSEQPNTQVQLQIQNLSQVYKHKFKYAKTIASFIIKNFNSSDFLQAKQYALYRINITNTLKICERKFNKNLSEMQKVPSLIRQLQEKYMEGIVTVMKRKRQSQDQQFTLGNNFPQISFLFYTEFKLPFMIYNCENTQQTEGNIQLLILTLNQGFQLVRKIKANGKLMIDQGMQDQSLVQSKFNITHLDKALKVEILGALCLLILSTLRFIENAAALMKKDPPGAGKKKLYTRQKPKDTPTQQQQDVIQKLQFLLELSKVIQSADSQFQQWRQQLKDTKQTENQQKTLMTQEEVSKQKGKQLEFKDKYLFPDYTDEINFIEKTLEKFNKFFESIIKLNSSNRLRKENYSRYIFCSKLWMSKINLQLGVKETSSSCLKEISNLKNEDLVCFYHHYENQPTEQNLVLAQYYSRDIVFHCLKIDAIEHLLEAYSARPETLEICIMLIRKLAKMYSQKIQPDKDKSKPKPKEDGTKQNQVNKDKKTDEAPKKKGKQEKDKEPEIQPEQKQKTKKDSKQPKESKDKGDKLNKFEIKIKWIHVLFLRGVELYLEAFINAINTKNQPMEQKYEKALLQFKNKIKREVEKDRKKPLAEVTEGTKLYGIQLVNDIQTFIQFYENKFERKVRMKAPKKQKVENTQPTNEKQKIDRLVSNISQPQLQIMELKKMSNLQLNMNSLVKKQVIDNPVSEEQVNSQSEIEQIENQNEIRIKKEQEEDFNIPDQMIDEREVQEQEDSGNL